MDIRVSIPGAVLEGSGALFLPDGLTEFAIQIEEIVLHFSFEGNDNNPTIDAKLANENKTLNIKLINWNNPLGTYKVFSEIATINDRTVDLSLSVNGTGGSELVGRQVVYSVTSTQKVAA